MESNRARPAFFEPEPTPISSILGKRKLGEAFGERIYHDQARYGQPIPPEYFLRNTGHCCYVKKK